MYIQILFHYTLSNLKHALNIFFCFIQKILYNKQAMKFVYKKAIDIIKVIK